jgi:PleD family two-component response regulator
MGQARRRGTGESLTELMKRADDALYAAKGLRQRQAAPSGALRIA